MESETTSTSARLKADVQLIKEWMSKQPHLPKVEDEEWLTSMLHHNKYSLEKTKNKLNKFFSFRTKYPEIFTNRDPTGPEISQARAAYKIVLADKLTKDGGQVVFGQMQSDTRIFDMKSFVKLMFMFCDTFYLERERHSHIVIIGDCRHLSYVHFLKGFSWIKNVIDIFLGAYSDRVYALHIINAPAHLDMVFNTVKGLIPQKMAERFQIHPTMAHLCKLVDEDVVCCEFGGKGPSLVEYDEYTRKRLERHREWFSEQDNVFSIEELRRKTNNKTEDMQGSFRKIEVD